MVKYVDTKVVFREIPNEITLAINISGCPCQCKGCHSSYLAEDIGEILSFTTLSKLIKDNTGITCVAFMGGDGDVFMINELAKHIRKNHPDLNIAWYSGRQELSEHIELCNFDFIKLGPYLEEFGPLDSPTTNQCFYHIFYENNEWNMIDITPIFWKNLMIDETIN